MHLFTRGSLYRLVVVGFFSTVPCISLYSAQLMHVASCAAMSNDGQVFVVGAGVGSGSYALAGGNRAYDTAWPIMTERAEVDGTADQKNPLYDASIAHLAVLEDYDVLGRISRYVPIAVSAKEPAKLYSVEQYTIIKDTESAEQNSTAKKEKTSPVRLSVANAVCDSTGKPTGSIVGIHAVSSPSRIIAAVTGSDGIWGNPGSGIALFTPAMQERQLSEVEKKALAEKRAQQKKENKDSDEPEQTTKRVAILKQSDLWLQKPEDSAIMRAAALDTTIHAVKINGPLSSLGTIVDMHWDALLNRLYIALQPTAGSAAQDGARCVVVGRFESIVEVDQDALKKREAERAQKQNEEKKDEPVPTKTRTVLHFDPICPISACGKPGENILGAIGADVHLDCHAVRTLHTSTQLDYLVVHVSGDNQPSEYVYALPLVRSGAALVQLNTRIASLNKELNEKITIKDSAGAAAVQAQLDAVRAQWRMVESAQGTLADYHEDPRATDIFGAELPQRFIERGFKKPATTVSQVSVIDNPAACVGGGAVPGGTIRAIYVRGDAVFVTVTDAVSGQESGVFCTQALFDETGKIKNWTQWHRAVSSVSSDGTQQSAHALVIDELGQKLVAVSDIAGKITAINRSAWHTGKEDGHALVDALNSAVAHEPAGILGFADFPAGMPGLADSSLFAAFSSRTIVLAHTGTVHNGVVVPETGDFVSGMMRYPASVKSELDPAQARVLVFQGGDLEKIAPLTSVALVHYKNTGILCAAGAGGVAVLIDEHGLGWQRLRNFADIPTGMQWKKIADWPFITKLIVDESYLYVLSDSELRRIDMRDFDSTGILASQPAVCTPIASTTAIAGLNKHSIFTDCVISGKCAILATSKGIFRNADDTDIRSVSSANQWVSVLLPESLDAVNRLFAVSPSGRQEDVARMGGGMLYALNVSARNNKGHLVRFSVSDVEHKAIDATTIQLLPDYYAKNVYAPWVDFEGYKDAYVTDGATHFAMRNRDGEQVSAAQVATRSVFRSGKRSFVDLPLNLQDACTVSCVAQCSATGAWFIGGDMGVWVNE